MVLLTVSLQLKTTSSTTQTVWKTVRSLLTGPGGGLLFMGLLLQNVNKYLGMLIKIKWGGKKTLSLSTLSNWGVRIQKVVENTQWQCCLLNWHVLIQAWNLLTVAFNVLLQKGWRKLLSLHLTSCQNQLVVICLIPVDCARANHTFNHVIRALHRQTSSYSTLKWLAMHSLCSWQCFCMRVTFLHWTLFVRQHPVFSRNSNICYDPCNLQPVSVSDCVENVCSTRVVVRISVYLFFQHPFVYLSSFFFRAATLWGEWIVVWAVWVCLVHGPVFGCSRGPGRSRCCFPSDRRSAPLQNLVPPHSLH